MATNSTDRNHRVNTLDPTRLDPANPASVDPANTDTADDARNAEIKPAEPAPSRPGSGIDEAGSRAPDPDDPRKISNPDAGI